MPTAIINGRRVNVPDSASSEEIKRAGKIHSERTLIQRKKDGNYAVKPGERLNVNDGDTFVDAPARVKGE